MSLTTRLVILAGLVGLMFYNASEQQLWAAIIDWQLGWYKLGVPIAWGIILGALVNLLGGTALLKWLEPITLVAASLTTLGLTGAAAVYGAHQIGGLTLAPLIYFKCRCWCLFICLQLCTVRRSAWSKRRRIRGFG